MTYKPKTDSWWLEGMAKKKGVTVEEMREIMRQTSALASRKGTGFASMDKDRLREVQEKGRQNRRHREEN